jgi:hypothetical protein
MKTWDWDLSQEIYENVRRVTEQRDLTELRVPSF